MGGGQSTAHSSTICLHYTTIFFFCQVFYTTFLELFLISCFYSLLRGTFWLSRPKRVPSLPKLGSARAARFPRGNSLSFFYARFAALPLTRINYETLTFLSPNYSTYPKCSLLSSSLSQACSAYALYHFW